MEEKLKTYYKAFIKRENNTYVGTITLNEEEDYKDIINLDEEDMSIINEFPEISRILSDEIALFIDYLEDEKIYMSAIKVKKMIGEYNDKISWNERLKNTGDTLNEALKKLNDNILENERSLSL